VLRDLKISGIVDLCRTLPPAIAVGSDEATQAAERVQIYEYNEHSRLVTRHACAVCDAVRTLNKLLTTWTQFMLCADSQHTDLWSWISCTVSGGFSLRHLKKCQCQTN